MTTIENIAFSFKRSKDDFVLQNKLNSALSFTISRLGCNDEQTIVASGLLQSFNQTLTIPITKDGKYILFINDYTTYFTSWKNTRNNLVKRINSLLCSNCKGCEDDCNKGSKCIKHQQLFNATLFYANIIKPFSFDTAVPYNTQMYRFIQASIDANFCFINKEFCNQTFQGAISGETQNNQDLFDYFIAIHYLAFYFYDKYSVLETDVVGRKYIESVWQYDKIKRCIKNLGICIEKLEELYEQEDPTPLPIPVITVEPIIYSASLYNNDDELLLLHAPIPMGMNFNDKTLTYMNLLTKGYSNTLYQAVAIKFTTLPSVGRFEYNGAPIALNQVYPVTAYWQYNIGLARFELISNKLFYNPLSAGVPISEPINETVEYIIVDSEGNEANALININLQPTNITVYHGYNTEYGVELDLSINLNNSVEIGNSNGGNGLTGAVTENSFIDPSTSYEQFEGIRFIEMPINGVIRRSVNGSPFEPVIIGMNYELVNGQGGNTTIFDFVSESTQDSIATIPYLLLIKGESEKTRVNFLYANIQVSELFSRSGHISFIATEDVTSIQDDRLIGKAYIDGYSVQGTMVQDVEIPFDSSTGTIPNVNVFAGEKVIVFFTTVPTIN